MGLILDVAKFKYDSYWCSIDSLYESLKPLDSVTAQSRGYLMNSHHNILGRTQSNEKDRDL